MKFTLLAFFILLAIKFTYAQNDVQLGSGISPRLYQTNAGLFDYSDPAAVNIKVAVWGFVRYPGKYIVPGYSNVNDLLSYSGGPTDAARLEDLRIIRINPDSSETIIPLNYKDLLFNSDVTKIKGSPQLKAGDVLLVSGEPRLYFTNYLQIALSIASTLISLSILLINIFKK